MAVVAAELLESRSRSFSQGKTTATTAYSVYDDSTPLTTDVSVLALFGTSGLPAYGDYYPDDVTLAAYDFTITKYDGQKDLWKVTWQYREVPLIGGQEKQPGEVGYVDVSIDGIAVFEDQWRSLTIAEITGLVAGAKYLYGSANGEISSAADIGGLPIDVYGEPISGPIRKKIQLTVSETLDYFPNVGFLEKFMGRRNNVQFSGAAIGSLVYVRPQIQRIDLNRWKVAHVIEKDNYYHLIQAPYRNPDGEIAKDAGGHAQWVFYRQPFPDFANFYALSQYFQGSGQV